MKKNVRNILSAVLVLVLLAVLLIVPAMAEENVTDVATYDQLVEALGQDGTIKLTDNIVVEDKLTIASGRTVVLELNGKTLSQEKAQSGAYSMIENKGVLTIQDSVGGGKISYADTATLTGYINYASNTITNGGTLSVLGGMIENNSGESIGEYGYPYTIDNNSTSANVELNINGGTLVCDAYCTVRLFCNSTTYRNTANISGDCILRGGVELQNPNANANNGSLNISGGAISNNNVKNAVYIFAPATGSDCGNLRANISGGLFTGPVTAGLGMDTAVNFNTQVITGGTFSTDVSAFCVSGNIAKQSGDSFVIVPSEDAAASVNGVGYLSLQAAIDAAKDGDTIEVLKDQTLTAQHVIDKDVTINGNNYALTTSTVQRLIWIKANVTINNLTVTNTVSNGRCIETRVGGIALNLNNVTLNAENGSTQALTVGGDAGDDGNVIVNMESCYIDSGSSGYGIITFNPVKLTIENSTAVCGYGALYLKPASSSVGSAGSRVEIIGSTLSSEGLGDGYSFGTLILEDNDIEVVVDENSELIAVTPNSGTGNQYAVCIQSKNYITDQPAVFTGITVNIAGEIMTDYYIRNLTSLENTVYVPSQYKEAVEKEYITSEAENGLIRVWATHEHDLQHNLLIEHTCTKDGSVEHYHCSICDMNFVDEAGTTVLEDVVIPAAHTFGDWMPKKEATCVEEGHEDHCYCSVCGLYKMLSSDGETYVDATEKEVVIPVIEHKGTHVEYKEKGCTENGVREHWVCEVCNKIFGDKEMTNEWQPEDVIIPAGHRYIPVEEKAATCAEDGNVEHYRCECGYMVVIDGEALKEVTLKDVTILAKGHTMTKVESKTPTCTGEGNVEYYNCSVCKKNFADEKGEKELATVVEAAKGHKLTKVEAKAATCTAAGNIEHYSCDGCKKLFADAEAKTEITAEKVAVAAKGHTEVAVAGKAATCTEAGLTEGKKCSVCGTVTVEQKTIDALGHKLTKVETKAATYSEAGNIEHYACACGKLFADAEGKKEITDVVIPQLIKVEEEKAEVSKDAVDNAIADAKEKAEETGKPVEVVIEVPKAPVVEKPEDGETGAPEEKPEQKPQEVVKVELPVQALENVAKEEANLTVVMPSVTVTVDTDALKAVTEQAAGNTVTLVVEQVKEETLTEKQQEVVKNYDVAVTIKAEFICQETNEKIWTEDNNTEKQTGSVTVKMPFTPAEGSEGSDYTVLYIADDGSVKEIKTSYENGNLVFALEHFSEYVVVNTKTTSVTPDTGDHAMLAPFALLLALSVMGMAVMTAGKKKLI